ncbi:MAG: hypothetical protein LBP35_05095 [Candidatus Ancillula trichonymphae]|nr:hypothetical protein [Candidatus Ancillula trichonymphae]
MYFNKNKRVIFAKTTHGLTFSKINGKFITQISIIPVVSVLLAYFAFGGSIGYTLGILFIPVAVSATSSSLSALALNRRLLKNHQQL